MAPSAFTMLVLIGAGVAIVQAELLNALNNPVRRQADTTGAPFTMETAGLAPDVYTLHIETGATVLAKRLIIQ